jgi:hypothetical protein
MKEIITEFYIRQNNNWTLASTFKGYIKHTENQQVVFNGCNYLVMTTTLDLDKGSFQIYMFRMG